MSVATKIGIQINAKLGGEIWAVQIPVCFIFIKALDFKLFASVHFNPHEAP